LTLGANDIVLADTYLSDSSSVRSEEHETANDAIEASTLFTTTRSGRITANTTNWSSLVELCTGMFIQCQCIFTMFIPASFFYKIVYFPNLDWVGGSQNKFGKIRWALKFLSTS
jgi:hypothetical protein